MSTYVHAINVWICWGEKEGVSHVLPRGGEDLHEGRLGEVDAGILGQLSPGLAAGGSSAARDCCTHLRSSARSGSSWSIAPDNFFWSPKDIYMYWFQGSDIKEDHKRWPYRSSLSVPTTGKVEDAALTRVNSLHMKVSGSEYTHTWQM